MQKIVTGLAILALAAIAIPSFAATAARVDEPMTAPGHPGPAHTRTNDCLGTVVWDTGMFDEFTPPSGCSTAGSAGCFVNALNDGGFPADGRRLADDFVSNGQPITAIKIWARYNQDGYDYHRATPGSLHGFCVKFYQPVDPTNPFCPDGSLPGEDAIGSIAYDQYSSNFTEYEITTGLPRNFNVCINLPTPFVGTAGNTYFVSVSADFDFTTGPGGGATQWFWRLMEGVYDPWCESMWWDTWNDPPTNWTPTSVALALPCWAGWNQSFVLYSGETPPLQGACCFTDGRCAVLTSDDCLAQSGSYQGDGTVCDPNPCPPPEVGS